MHIPATPPLVTGPVAIFLIVLVIILVAPIVLNKLKIPHIIGLIVAGVAVGPYGFNILADDSSFKVFGQVGMLYLMFLAGLEIDMYHLRLNLRKGVFFGFLTFLIPLGLGIVSSRYLLGVDWLTSGLLGSMYASHTLLSYPVAARYGVTKSAPVLVAVVGTIVAVTASLLTLAAVVTSQKEGGFNFGSTLFLIGKLLLWLALVIFVYPRVTRYFFKYFHDKVTQFVFVLSMVFLAAWTAQTISLEAVLGAFVAGLVLNRYVPQSSPLMSSIEFVGNALFIPYFLIGVGMIINIRVVTNPDTLLVTGIMLAVALLGKWLPAWIAGRISGFQSGGTGLLFGLSTAHTAVALAVVTIGYNLGMLDVVVLNATVLVILCTCAIAPSITAAYAPKLKIQMINEGGGFSMDQSRKSKNILVTVAAPLISQPLVELAMLMRDENGNGSLLALHVRTSSDNRSRAMSRAALQEASDTAAAANVDIETHERFDVNVSAGVLASVEEKDIDILVLGLHRRAAILDSFLGTKLEQLLKSTNRMVIISRCFIPLNTMTRIIVWVPAKAEFETGFGEWVASLGRLGRQIGCRVIFCCTKECAGMIRAVLKAADISIRLEFREINSPDDFILLSGHVLDDDLFAIVCARPNSVSYSADMVEIPEYLQRYFKRNNLLLIYPGQFGETESYMSFSDPLATDIVAQPAPWMVKLKARWRKLVGLKKRITGFAHHRHPHDDNPLNL